jgi:hypothetical protein
VFRFFAKRFNESAHSAVIGHGTQSTSLDLKADGGRAATLAWSDNDKT